MMYKSILSAVMALAAIVCFGLGCAGSILLPPEHFKSMEKTAKEGESEIVFTKPSRFIGGGAGASGVAIYIDDVERLRLGNGKTETVVVPDGRHELRACHPLASAGCGKNRKIVVNAAGNRTVLTVGWDKEYLDGMGRDTLRAILMDADDGKWISVPLNKYAEFPLHGSTVAQTKSSVEPRAEASSSRTGAVAGGLEEAIKNATLKMINDLPDGSKIAIVEMATDDWELASTIIDEVEFNFVSSKRYTIVDRKTLDLIREEQILQTSGDVSDETIVKIGALSGANVVIAGSLTKSEGANRLSLRALDVQTGQIITMARESY